VLPRGFNKQVRKIIDTLAFPMYAVILSEKQVCTCLDVNNKANVNCKKCLGTGKRIKIIKIEGAMEPEDLAVRLTGQSNTVISNLYYFDAEKVPMEVVQPYNIIVRDNEADVLQTARTYRSDSNDPIYYCIEGVKKKSNLDIFLKNFYEIVGDSA
jgi:hypothetical protein